jgi:cyclic pyranopterin phosphate synthase
VLADSYGRVATDLRVSLTDRCNLRCAYCMPAEGLAWLPRPELLTDGEVALRAAGLDRINVSLDTLRPDVFRALARRDRLGDVLDGLAAAAAAGLAPVKVNTVLMRGRNDGEAVPLLRFCLEHGYELRFIEQMPLDAQHGWRREDMVTADEILGALCAEFTLTPDDPSARGSAPAETFLVDGGPARVGVIGSVTRPFCGTCDRVRLTADGQVRNCLFARDESNLRDPMRSGADDAELARIWRRAVAAKLPGHGINDPGFLQPVRPMSAIGG